MDQVCEIPLENPDAHTIKDILEKYGRIAVVGLSNDPEKPSHRVAEYLKRNGYRIYPVNPRYESILGERCYAAIGEIPDPVDIVDIFRKPSAVPDIVEDAIRCGAKAIWMQLGIVNNEAAQRAREAGLAVVMDKCMMVEHKRLIGDAHSTGR